MAKRRAVATEASSLELGSESYSNFVRLTHELRYEGKRLTGCDNFHYVSYVLSVTELLRQFALWSERGEEAYEEYLKFGGRTPNAQDIVRLEKFFRIEDTVVTNYRHFHKRALRRSKDLGSTILMLHEDILSPGMLFRTIFTPMRLYAYNQRKEILQLVSNITTRLCQLDDPDAYDVITACEAIVSAVKSHDPKIAIVALTELKVADK